MGDSDKALPLSKKRVAGREISRENPGLDDDDASSELEVGSFKKASDDVMATRRIVKVKRNQPASAATATPSSNPFANIQLVPSTRPVSDNVSPAESCKSEDKNETERESDVKEPNGTGEHANSVTETSDKEKSYSQDEADKPPVRAGETESGVEETKKDLAEEAGKPVDGDKKSEDVGQSEGTDLKPEDTEKGVAEEAGKPVDGDKKSEDVGQSECTDLKPEEAEKVENSDKKTEIGREESKNDSSVPLSSFQQLSSSQNAFTGLAGTGFSSSSFSFGSFSKDGSAFSSGTGSVFGLKNENSSFPSFVIENSNNGTRSEGSGIPSMQEVQVETGEENEKAVFTADASLFEYMSGGWKERGKGEVKVNVSTTDPEKARLVMRARGNYRLILNAYLYPDMKLTIMDKKGINFACINSATEGKDGLSTFALRFKDSSVVEEFRGAVTEHKGKKTGSLKTPENSPKASDE